MYAVGPFTRLVFSIKDGTLLLMTYRKWPEGLQGIFVKPRKVNHVAFN